MNKVSILIVGSRSGGHILPGLTLGKLWACESAAVYFVAENRPLDHALVSKESWLTKSFFLDIMYPLLSRPWYYPWYVWSFVKALFTSWRIIRTHSITRVVALGAYSSVPVCLAAWFSGVPYELYELNAELGKAVSWLQYGAQTISCCFSEALSSVRPRAHKLIPYPLRDLSLGMSQPPSQSSPVREVGTGKGFVLLILGGSQGSQSLSKLVLDWVSLLTPFERAMLFVFHQTGVGEAHVRNEYQRLQVAAEVFNYRDNLASLYLYCDLVVTRGGSGALHEIIYFQKPALIIPLEASTTHHQVANAQAVERRNPEVWRMVRQSEVDRLHKLLYEYLAKVKVNVASVSRASAPLFDQ
jgi:UDP-N-acetylglucosamine--N-acetylmuramyl-(pentapeptide) pyrophosphoryl-undecaprenol N-acetylglucosamine transferase